MPKRPDSSKSPAKLDPFEVRKQLVLLKLGKVPKAKRKPKSIGYNG